jgi:hypothetical protein
MASFKQPTHQELARDYLWRVHAAGAQGRRDHHLQSQPLRGRAGGSREDLVPEDVWSKRFAHINDFERLLPTRGRPSSRSSSTSRRTSSANGCRPASTTRPSTGSSCGRPRRPGAVGRLPGCIRGRARTTSQAHAPWYIVPADRKWYRDLVVSSILIAALESLDLRVSPNDDDLSDRRVSDRL